MTPNLKRAFVGVVALLALGLAAAPASAHATLETTTPANGAELPAGRSPGAVSLKFSENVQIPDNAIRVISAGSGAAVDIGAPGHGTSDSVVSVPLPKLADGTYVVSWRVVSTDSHIVSGALSFAVGPSQGTLATARPNGPGPNRVVGFVFGVVRTAAFIGVLVLIGGALFRRSMWPGGVPNLGVGRLIGGAWVLGFVTALFGLCLQGVASGGVGLGSLLDSSLVSNVLDTDYGHALLARAILLVVLVPVLWLLPRRLLAVDAAAVLVGLGIVATFLYAGHAHSGRWVGLAMVTDELHVSAAAVWFGGLCALAVSFAAVRVEDSRFALSRYTIVAAPAIAVVVLSGTVQSLRQVGTFSALIHTGYGRLLLVKVALVVVILIAANTSRRIAGNRLLAEADAPVANRNARRKARNADQSALSALRKAVLVEVAFAIVVLAVTAALTNTQPAREVTSGKAWPGAPFSQVLPAAPLSLAVAVKPGHTGTNRVTLTPRAASGSGAAVKVVDVSGSISQPDAGIAKLTITFEREPNGSYAGSLDIPLPGIWQLDLSVLRNQFDESRATADLPIGVAANGPTTPTPTTSGLTPEGVARVIKPYRDKLIAGLERDRQICPGPAQSAECGKLLRDLDATAVSLSRKLRASSPQFSIESTMYFTVDSADEFAAGVQSYLATGCGTAGGTVGVDTCRQSTQLYRDPASEFERNLRGWDPYL